MNDDTQVRRAGVATSEVKRKPKGNVARYVPPALHSVTDAAEVLGIGKTLLWKLIRSGDVPVVRLGRRVLVPHAVLQDLSERWLEAYPEPPLEP